MRTQENVTLYHCEFCKKKLVVKHAMKKHEYWCTKNPKNSKRCADVCMHLKEVMVEYDGYYSGDHGTHMQTTKGFYCEAKKCGVYLLIVEKKQLVEKYPETFEGSIPMPKECNDYRGEFTF